MRIIEGFQFVIEHNGLQHSGHFVVNDLECTRVPVFTCGGSVVTSLTDLLTFLFHNIERGAAV